MIQNKKYYQKAFSIFSVKLFHLVIGIHRSSDLEFSHEFCHLICLVFYKKEAFRCGKASDILSYKTIKPSPAMGPASSCALYFRFLSSSGSKNNHEKDFCKIYLGISVRDAPSRPVQHFAARLKPVRYRNSRDRQTGVSSHRYRHA